MFQPKYCVSNAYSVVKMDLNAEGYRYDCDIPFNFTISQCLTKCWSIIEADVVLFYLLCRYSLVKLKEDTLCLVATDAIPRLSSELNSPCDVIDSVSTSQLNELVCTHAMDSSRTVRLYHASHATADKGSGIVHTAPAHGVEDFEVACQHSLSTVTSSLTSNMAKL